MLAGESLTQRLALDERHHIVKKAVGLAGIVDRKYVRVRQVCGDLDLAQEPLRSQRSRDVRPQHLQCDLSIVLQVMRHKHNRRTTSSQLALQPVAPGQRPVQLLQYVRHDHGGRM